jgi:hypothetical protein
LPTIVEYWVYLPDTELPAQDHVLKHMFSGPAASRLEPKDGLLLSDIRLHVGMALRSKNASLFRPDLIDEIKGLAPDILSAIAGSRAVIRLRFVSESPLADRRYCKSLAHLAAAYAEVSRAPVVYDRMKAELLSTESFVSRLCESHQADFHVRVSWNPVSSEVVTHGLTKAGLAEWATSLERDDLRATVVAVVEQAADLAFELGRLPLDESFEYLGDRYQIVFHPGPFTTQLQVGRIESS